MKVAQSCLTLCNPMNYTYSPWNSPGQNTGVGSLSLLQGIFPTQGSNLGLLHCRRILYQLRHKRSPKNTGVGSLSLLQQIFPTQESNQGLLHCRQILYQLSYEGISYSISILQFIKQSMTRQTNCHNFQSDESKEKTACLFVEKSLSFLRPTSPRTGDPKST